MKNLMKKLSRLGILQLLIVLVLMFVTVRFMTWRYEAADKPEIFEGELEPGKPDAAPEGEMQTLKLSGMSLFRVNNLYIDGRRVKVLHHEAIDYSQCRLCVPVGTFVPGQKYEIAVGKSYTITLGEVYRSNTIEFEVQ